MQFDRYAGRDIGSKDGAAFQIIVLVRKIQMLRSLEEFGAQAMQFVSIVCSGRQQLGGLCLGKLLGEGYCYASQDITASRRPLRQCDCSDLLDFG